MFLTILDPSCLFTLNSNCFYFSHLGELVMLLNINTEWSNKVPDIQTDIRLWKLCLQERQ